MFALIWMNRALEQLANVYVTATPEERERIAAAVDALNARLRSDPLSEGESRSGGFRITFPSLLSVLFHVSETDRVVHVARVMRYGR